MHVLLYPEAVTTAAADALASAAAQVDDAETIALYRGLSRWTDQQAFAHAIDHLGLAAFTPAALRLIAGFYESEAERLAARDDRNRAAAAVDLRAL